MSLYQVHGSNLRISQPSSAATLVQPTAQFPAVVDPLTQAAVAQVGAVYQAAAAAAAAYKAVAASGFMPNLSQNVASLAPPPSQPQTGCMVYHLKKNLTLFIILNVTFTLINMQLSSVFSRALGTNIQDACVQPVNSHHSHLSVIVERSFGVLLMMGRWQVISSD